MFVPVPAEVLRVTLTDPDRVVRCVPGLQRDADAQAGPLTGRLRVRIGGNTITYRGTLTIAERDGAVVYEGQGTEARGKGTAAGTLTLALAPADGGTRLRVTGTLTAEGRLAEATPDARSTTAARLLNRFVEAATAMSEGAAKPGGSEGAGVAAGGVSGGGAADEGVAGSGGRPDGDSFAGSDARDVGADGSDAVDAGADGVDVGSDGVDDGAVGVANGADGADGAADETDETDGADGADGADRAAGADHVGEGSDDTDRADTPASDPAPAPDPDSTPGSVFDAPVPPSSLDPLLGEDFGGASLEFPSPPPAAEAAHARRTMIGRSAEEVDHAPPRGRYAPVPAPETGSAGAALRWIAPAAVLALASAVVIGRALRRRR
ncbi:hypothetical protein BU197_27895 [Streptomyces sp. CBMA291]|nr:hypothetical protein [Streptomyces sp. CBMA291]MBD0717986.1 hypothetical protein [Streptomyces sp. CBMA370]